MLAKNRQWRHWLWRQFMAWKRFFNRQRIKPTWVWKKDKWWEHWRWVRYWRFMHKYRYWRRIWRRLPVKRRRVDYHISTCFSKEPEFDDRLTEPEPNFGWVWL